jgi:hypothetical protein
MRWDVKRPKRRREWRRWFAWYPVRVPYTLDRAGVLGDHNVWLERVDRKRVVVADHKSLFGGFSYWEYRAPSN